MSVRWKQEDIAKDNFMSIAMRNRYSIELDDNDLIIEQKILGEWIDPNAPVVEIGEEDEDGFIEF